MNLQTPVTPDDVIAHLAHIELLSTHISGTIEFAYWRDTNRDGFNSARILWRGVMSKQRIAAL